MRPIGNLPDEQQARLFGDFLVAHGMRNAIEQDPPGVWSVWIVDEDQIAEASTWLEKFRDNPKASEFQAGAAKADKVRAAEAKDLADYQRRVRTGASVFPSTRAYGAGALTCGLILLCIVVAIFSKLGANREFLNHLFIIDPTNHSDKFLPEISSGEVWRLFTPMLIHLGPVHLIFNMLYLFQVGSMIEGRQSPWVLAALVFTVEPLTVIAQYFASGPVFGGMSGVVYALAGYVWIHGRFDRASGLFLDSRSVTILLVWLVLCYSGAMGNIANTSHVVGLLVGMAWGGISAMIATRRIR